MKFADQKLLNKIAAVEQAELACVRERRAAENAWLHLKSEVRRSATPLRIVAGGFGLGVASGIGLPGTKAVGSAGKGLIGPLFSMVFESVVPGLLAGMTAAKATEESVVPAVEEAVQQAVPEAVDDAVGAVAEDTGAPIPARKKRKPRKRRVDPA